MTDMKPLSELKTISLFGTNFSEFGLKTLWFSFAKMYLKMSSPEGWPFFLGLNADISGLVQDCSISITNALEILHRYVYSTVLQPLRINVDEDVVLNIDNILSLKHDKEDAMKSVFSLARHMAQNEIKELLQDYRQKRALGKQSCTHLWHDNFMTIVVITVTQGLYPQISNIICTKFKNWNVSHRVLQLSLPSPLKSGVMSRMKM